MPEPNSASAQKIWTTLDLIGWTKSYFERRGLEHPRLEAELLLAEVLGCARIRLYVEFEKPVASEVLVRFREMVKRRGENREPLQYIIGHVQFVDLKLKVTPAALIPRPETEVLAAWAVKTLEGEKGRRGEGEKARVLDLCTGSGCVALYVASKVSDAQVVATDLSGDALGLAKENGAGLKLSERMSFKQGDLFEALDEKMQFDLITANPPYVDAAVKDSLQPEVRDFEPALALFSENGGTALAERILRECGPWLKAGAYIGMEFGIGQGEVLKACAEKTGFFDEIGLEPDHNRVPRFLMARKREGTQTTEVT